MTRPSAVFSSPCSLLLNRIDRTVADHAVDRSLFASNSVDSTTQCPEQSSNPDTVLTADFLTYYLIQDIPIVI
jgi:hypothetical protein